MPVKSEPYSLSDLYLYKALEMRTMRKRLLFLGICIFAIAACSKADDTFDSGNSHNSAEEICANAGCALDRIYSTPAGTFLYSGSDSSTHFQINNWELDPAKLRDHGLDREAFPALTDPKFKPLKEVDFRYSAQSKFIVVEGASQTRAYPFSLMTYHEVINDQMEGQKFLVAYCVLADFAMVYDRSFCGHDFTFGVSGYTYLNERPDTSDPIQAFILWDRDTESLWNPLDHEGVSHIMKNVSMEPFTKMNWSVMNLQSLQHDFPEAKVLAAGQNLAVPENWPRISCSSLNCCSN